VKRGVILDYYPMRVLSLFVYRLEIMGVGRVNAIAARGGKGQGQHTRASVCLNQRHQFVPLAGQRIYYLILPKSCHILTL